MEQLAILDCGGQYTKVIDRKVRELGVRSEIFPVSVPAEELRGFGGVILSGGPSSVWSENALRCDEAVFALGVPVLGICYGMQLLNAHFGGEVVPGLRTEYGETDVDCDLACPLFAGLERARQSVLMSHGDSCRTLAPGFRPMAMSGDVIAGIFDAARGLYGVQFHPEVDLTENGRQMLENFLRGVCGFTGRYTLEERIQASVDMIRSRVGDRDVMVLVSGGVDSAVTAALLLRALPAGQVHGIHIDHGFMRKNESDLICEELKKQGLTNLVRVDAEETFLMTSLTIDGKTYPPLCEVSDPETKRLLIGTLFIRVTRQAAQALGIDFDTAFLAQGTLRPDLIESGNPDVSGYAHKIKTHHNDVDVVRRARERGLVIETNWDWHKDEVREVARMLGLREEIAARQPFPGPGLAVRTICTEGEKPVPAIRQRALSDALAARFPALRGVVAPVRTVGVQGDCRSYRSLAILTQAEGEPDFSALYAAARDLPNTLDFMSRTAFCLNRREPPALDCFPLHLRHNRLELLRELDARVTRALAPYRISQTFAVLLPVGEGRRRVSVAIRAFITSDFMTGRPAAPGKDFGWDVLYDLAARIERDFPEVDLVLYDCTPKPPATVEWE